MTEGENIEVLYTPDFGYSIDKIYLDGNEIKHSNGKYIIMNVTSNHELSATFMVKDTHPIINKVREGITKTTKYIQDSGYTSDWIAVGLANAEEKIPNNYLKNLSNEIMDYFKDTVNTKAEKVTDHERQILSVVAAGGNPTSIGGQNLVERVYNFYIDDYKRDITFQGINGVIYGLIAMNTKNYEIPEGARYSRDWMINYLLEKQNSDGGWDLSSLGTSDVDITAMTLQALAPYHGKTKVKEAVNKGIDWLSKKQQTDGGFGSTETVNSEAVSQTIIALCANGIDPTGKDFTKGGKNLLDALLNLQNANGSFSHVKNEGENNIATEQGYLGLLAYDKYVKAGEKYNDGKTSVYSFLETSFKDSIPPVITTSLTNKTVQTSSYSFTAHGVDDVDGAVPVTVKQNSKEIKGNNYNYSVTLKEGKNTITLSAVDENGNKTEKIYTITYEPKKQDQGNTGGGKKNDGKHSNNTNGSGTNTGTSSGNSSTYNDEESTESEAIQTLRKEISEKIAKAEPGTTLTIDMEEDLTINAAMLDELKEKENVNVVFKGENYTLSFNTADITGEYDEDMNMDLALTFASDNADKIAELTGSDNSMILHFNYHGELPVPVTVVVKLPDDLKDKNPLYLYYYNEETGAAELVEDANLIIQDGYAQFTITHCSDYALTDTIVVGVSTEEEATTETPTPTQKAEQTGSNMPMILILGGALLVLGVLVVVLYNKKKQQS